MFRGKRFNHIIFLFLIIVFFVLFPSSALADYGDTTPPVSSLSCTPNSPNGLNGWYTTPLSCKISSDDLISGVASIHWRNDSSSWQSQSFPLSLNLASNSSFEDGDTVGNIYLWEKLGTGDFFHDSSNYFIGTRSASIVNSASSISAWHNKINYAVSHFLQNISASLWVRTSNISGNGVRTELYELTTSGEYLLASSSYITGTGGWTRVSLGGIVSHENAYGVYLKLLIDGVGSVWFDAVTIKETPTDTSVDQFLSAEGAHSFSYYAVDQEGNQESTRNFSYKLDSVPPGNWRGFDVFKLFGPEYILWSYIEVSDATSGLQPYTDMFQYSVNAGATWGYYSNLTSCSSTWVNNGWRGILSVFPFPGVSDLILITPYINYCNADWTVCKIIRFKVSDMAGNWATTDVCINGSWFRVNNGLLSGRSNFEINAKGSNSNHSNDQVFVGGSYINQLSVDNDRLITQYLMDTPPSYNSVLNMVASPSVISSLSTASGVYLTNQNLELTSATLPSGFSSSPFSSIIFVNGDLRILTNINISAGSAISFIVKGNIDVSGSVTSINGFYMADGNFNSAFDGGDDRAVLTITGGVVAETFLLNRSLSHYNNIDNPAEVFNFSPKHLDLLTPYFNQTPSVFWTEM